MRPASRLRIALLYARVWKKSRLLRVRVRLSLAPPVHLSSRGLRLYSGGRAWRWSRRNGPRKDVRRPGYVCQTRRQPAYRQAPRRCKLYAKSACIIFIPPKILTPYSVSLQLQLVQQNPQLAQGLIGSDPRMIDVLGALMGIDMQGFSRPEGSDEVPPGVPKSAASPPSSPPPSAKRTPSSAASSSKVHEPEDVKMAGADQAGAEEDEDAAVKKEAEAEKKLGADAYKKRDFATAITHFTKAWDTWPKDIAFLTNLAGEALL